MARINEKEYRMLLEDAETIALATSLLRQVIDTFIKRVEDLMNKEEVFKGGVNFGNS